MPKKKTKTTAIWRPIKEADNHEDPVVVTISWGREEFKSDWICSYPWGSEEGQYNILRVGRLGDCIEAGKEYCASGDRKRMLVMEFNKKADCSIEMQRKLAEKYGFNE